jgi:hypothetical protein
MLVYLNLKAAALAPRGFRLDRENWSGHGEELKKVEALLKKMPCAPYHFGFRFFVGRPLQ